MNIYFNAYLGVQVRFRFWGLGFRVFVCLETNLVSQSAVPSTSQKEHWPCAVKTHFPRQHRCLGRIYILVIYTHIYISFYV